MSTSELLECGHPATPQPPSQMCGGAGYGMDAEGRRYCYACCAERTKADMIATGRATLYLRAPTRGQIEPQRKNYSVVDWPNTLSFVAFNYRHSRNGGGFGCQRTDVDFVGPDGYIWHAVNRGDMDLARCKRTKRLYIRTGKRKAAPGIAEVSP